MFSKKIFVFDGNVSKECFPKGCLLAVREGLLLQYLLFERILKCISVVPATFQNISQIRLAAYLENVPNVSLFRPFQEFLLSCVACSNSKIRREIDLFNFCYRLHF